MSINGKVNYLHLPYDEEGAFTFCNHCKKTCERVTIELHQGFLEDWINLICSRCKKSIWTSELDRKRTKDNKKCFNCKKPTNNMDCDCSVCGGKLGKRIRYYCSEKCYNKKEQENEHQ